MCPLGRWFKPKKEPQPRVRKLADRIPQAISSSIAGQMMTEDNYVLPHVITSVLYFCGNRPFLIFFRKRKRQ